MFFKQQKNNYLLLPRAWTRFSRMVVETHNQSTSQDGLNAILKPLLFYLLILFQYIQMKIRMSGWVIWSQYEREVAIYDRERDLK